MESYANIYKEKGYYRVVFNMGATKLLNVREICFDKKNFIIRMPTIYDNKVYKIANSKTKNAAFAFSYGRDHEEDITGKYTIEQEGDEYLMIKR